MLLCKHARTVIRGFHGCYSTIANSKIETVTVKGSSNGNINLDIHHPLVATQRQSPVILYLPRGPILEAQSSDDEAVNLLSTSSGCTIVKVNYRLSKQHQYPTPIHDVLAAYDWALRYLVAGWPSRGGHARPGAAPIGVCGELIGGSLATMLALTECRTGETRIGAAAVSNALTDWVLPSHLPHPSQQRQNNKRKTSTIDPWQLYGKDGPLTASVLHQIRTAAFARPAHYFDPFASPIHFLRTPGTEIPSPETLLNDEFAALLGLWEDEDVKPYDADEGKRRKLPRKWPPPGLALELPYMRVAVGMTPVSGQGEELVKRLQSSIIKNKTALTDKLIEQLGDRSNDENLLLSEATAEADRKVVLHHITSGSGLWCVRDSDLWREEIMLTGNWLRGILTSS